MRHLGLGCLLLTTALSGHAAVLGQLNGTAVIGRPLDVRAQVVLGANEDAQALCARADVSYGDSLLPASVVRTQIQKSPGDATVSVSIQTLFAVNEPVVSVDLRLGCDVPFSRRYVLLADLVADSPDPIGIGGATSSTSEPPPIRDVVASPVPAWLYADKETPSSSSVNLPPVQAAAASSTAVVVPQPKIGTSSRAVRRSQSVVRRTAPAAASRLQLDALDIRLESARDPVLKFSGMMLTEPSTSDETRAAAAQLWKVLNASPEDMLRDAQQLQALEAEAKGLREQVAREQASLAAAQESLQRSRYLSWFVYGIGTILLVVIVGLLLFWRKQKQSSNSLTKAWWASATSEKPPVSIQPTASSNTTVAHDLLSSPALAQEQESQTSEEDMHPLTDAESMPSGTSTLSHVADRQNVALVDSTKTSLSVAAEELFDVQQKADFFVSLGDHDRAVQVLQHHLAEGQQFSPLAYLDLLKLYHRLDRRDDYERLRRDFDHVLNANTPPFDNFSEGSRSLEDYSDALQRIQALWLQPRVLDVIEKSIFCEKGGASTGVFDLEAYRDLLLLHAIAKDLVSRDTVDNNAQMHGFEHTDISPLEALGRRSSVGAAAPGSLNGLYGVSSMDNSSELVPSQNLDLDLGQFAPLSPLEDSQSSSGLNQSEVDSNSTFESKKSGESSLDYSLDLSVVDLDARSNEDKSPTNKA